MERVYYDIADNFVKDLEKNLNKSIEINEKENKIKIENEIIKYEEKDIGVRSFSVPYFVENQTIINYDGNDKELTNKIEDICTAYTDREIEAIEETMPILKKYSEERKKNLEGVAIIWRDHFLEENVGLLTSMVRMGVKPEDVLAIDKGDSTKHRQEITATFKKLGYQVDVLDNTAVANDILIEDGKRLIREFIDKRKDKKIVIFFSENIVGLLNQITIIFTRRQLNIETLSVSPSAIKGIHKFTITTFADEDMIDKVVKQIDKRVDILKAYYNTDEDLVYQEIALYKLSTELFIKMGTVEGLIRKYNARILEMNETCVVLEKSGHYDETQALFNELSETIGVLQFIRSGRVAITKSKVERLSDMLADMERKLQEKQQ